MQNNKNKIKETIIQDFDEIQNLIKERPKLGSKKWILTNILELGGYKYELTIEDGHIQGKLILEYQPEKNRFEVLEERFD